MANLSLRNLIWAVGLVSVARGARVRGIRGQEMPPPGEVTEKVAQGMESARIHAETAYQAAMQQMLNISGDMLKKVESHGQVAPNTILQLNDAITRSQAAKDLEDAVGRHNKLIGSFTDAVDKVQELQDQMRTLREQQADLHKATEAKNKQDFADEVKKMQDSWETLRKGHQDKEIETLGKILDQFDMIHTSNNDISGKDEEMNGAGNLQVHPHVDEGVVAVRDWTNGELADTCLFYEESEVPEIKAVVETLQAGFTKHGLILEKDALCRAIIDALRGKVVSGPDDEAEPHSLDNPSGHSLDDPETLSGISTGDLDLEPSSTASAGRRPSSSVAQPSSASSRTLDEDERGSTRSVRVQDEDAWDIDFEDEVDSSSSSQLAKRREEGDGSHPKSSSQQARSHTGSSTGSQTKSVTTSSSRTVESSSRPQSTAETVNVYVKKGYLQCRKVCKQIKKNNGDCRMSKMGMFKHFFGHIGEVVGDGVGKTIVTAFCTTRCGAKNKDNKKRSWWSRKFASDAYCTSSCAPGHRGRTCI